MATTRTAEQLKAWPGPSTNCWQQECPSPICPEHRTQPPAASWASPRNNDGGPRLVRPSHHHLRRAVREVTIRPREQGPDFLLESGQQGEVDSEPGHERQR